MPMLVIRISEVAPVISTPHKANWQSSTLENLICQTEEDFTLVECFQGRDCLCVIEPACVLKKVLRAALAAFFEALDGYTLAELVKPSRNLVRLLAMPRT